jgi:NTP pyrophosphatase (non-canonical NTP hydrolase)
LQKSCDIIKSVKNITKQTKEAKKTMISKESVKLIKKFRDERDWAQFHNPKDLAISINLEASELLEIFQWSGGDLECRDKLDKIKEELADVLCYCVLMADRCGLDMDEIIKEKMKKNGEKYPVEAAYGSKEKYTKFKK